MSKIKSHNGFAIAIAWPETYCKQPGSWYDSLMTLFGINNNNYYKVGHAALCLINAENGKVYYFDFGRYHSPFQHGRVRGANTDPELKVKTIAKIDKQANTVINFSEILTELQHNASCHGEGAIHASYCTIHFNKAYQKVLHLQSDFIPYGPFITKGSNCSRFVNIAILAGKPNFKHQFNLKYNVPFTPTPLSNVKSLQHYTTIPKVLNNKVFYPYKKLDKQQQKNVLPKPIKPKNIPNDSQWLSGEGAGSWFYFSTENNQIRVERYSPEGSIENKGLFVPTTQLPLNYTTLKVGYPSNSKTVTLLSSDQKFILQRVSSN